MPATSLTSIAVAQLMILAKRRAEDVEALDAEAFTRPDDGLSVPLELGDHHSTSKTMVTATGG